MSTKTRLKILNSAIEVYAKKGLQNTTVRDIAQNAGIALGLLNYHFPESKNLFKVVIQHIYAIAIPQINQHPNQIPKTTIETEDRLVMIFRNNMHFFLKQNRSYYACILQAYSAATYSRSIKALNRKIYKQSIERLKTICRQNSFKLPPELYWHFLEGSLVFGFQIEISKLDDWIKAREQSLKTMYQSSI